MVTRLKQRNIIWDFPIIERCVHMITARIINRSLVWELPDFCSTIDEELWREDERNR